MSTFQQRFKASIREHHEQLTGWPWREIEVADPAPHNDAMDDPASHGISTTQYVSTLPVLRDGGVSAGGLVLHLPRCGLTVVTTSWRGPADGYPGRGYWGVTVVAGSPTYKVGGYDLMTGSDEVASATEVQLPQVQAPGPEAPVRRYAASSIGRILKLSDGAVVLVFQTRGNYDYPGTKSAMECVVLQGVGTQRRGDHIAVPDPQIETATLIEV